MVKRLLLSALASGAVALALSCASQPAVDVAAEEAAVRDVVQQTLAGFQNQDWESVAGLVSDDYTVYSHMGDKWSFAELQEFFAANITDHTINISGITVEVSGDGMMAWATFDEATTYNFQGDPVDESAIFTAVLEKTDDAWQMVHLHRTVVVPEGGM